MLPRISPDSFIISFKLPRVFPKRIGQIFYINHPRYGRIVKTLAKIEDSDVFWFSGESAESVSVEEIGMLTHEQVIGLVFWVVKPK